MTVIEALIKEKWSFLHIKNVVTPVLAIIYNMELTQSEMAGGERQGTLPADVIL
jgi:hypothetical protein